MDDLDQQLAHLQLLNTRDLSPKPQNAGAPSSGSSSATAASMMSMMLNSSSTGSGLVTGGLVSGLVKKVGPAVPPKPAKKPYQPGSAVLYANAAQALGDEPPPPPPPPQYIVEAVAQHFEPPPPPPLHGNNNNSHLHHNSAPQSIVQINNNSNPHAHHNNVYSNIQMTLDNPAVLEQKLEALEHHKRVLENQRRLAATAASTDEHHAPSKARIGYSTQPADVGASSAGGQIYENHQQLYENLKLSGSQQHQPQQQQLYGNLMHHRQASSDYSNYPPSYGGHRAPGDRDSTGDELPPPPPPPALLQQRSTGAAGSVLNLLLASSDFQATGGSEDELPPPPSPVSSSYSELRRATADHHYPAMATYPGDVPANGAVHYQQLNNGGGAHMHHQAHQQQSLNGGPAARSNGGATYANNYAPAMADYGEYAPSLPGSSTYESIYEPINPRPPSQMSSRSNYSLYNPYVSGPQGAGGVGTIGTSAAANGRPPGAAGQRHHPHKDEEAEVDILTDLLVQSMDGSDAASAGSSAPGASGNYGVCVQCGERVVGESSGCTAMEQIYHIACFTCCQCQINLQGKPFYALDGKPCCEDDYLNTLEKCSVCMKPILERILRATGKPYHPGCFCCVVCGKSLDGVPFTVDATNQNHCIEDFHKKFAPRCCVCRQPILPEPGKEETVRVVALDRSFHVTCYKCEDCGLLLSSEAEGRGCFPLDDHILCKSCNAKRVQTLTSHMSTEL